MSANRERKLKIGVFSMDGIGHLAACIGIIQPLINRGHDVFFLLNESFKGKLEAYNIREVHLIETSKKNQSTEKTQQNEKSEQDEDKENIAKRNGYMLLQAGILSGISSLEKMQTFKKSPFLKTLKDAIIDFDSQIENTIALEKPDLLIIDHFLLPPSFYKCGVPYAFIHSCSPLLVYDQPTLPPAFSGCFTNSNPETWKPYQEKIENNFRARFHAYQQELFKNAGIEVEYKTMIFLSPYLNIYAYPKELDYEDIYKPPETFFRIDAFSREEPETDEELLPKRFVERPRDVGLIYFSLGSMGGVDLELMKKLTSWFSESKHMFIVSKGPRAGEYELNADNIYSASFLPQTKLLPLCDLVITHGGNNSTTETLYAGKPMIILPLFADQYDNGTRVEETGCGYQFNPYHVTKEQIFKTIDDILTDQEMRQKTQKIRERILKDQSKISLAKRLEKLVQDYSRKE